MNNLISVIIPNHNYGRYLATTIESVLSQTIGELELIVIDNGSTDNSREVLDKYRRELTAIYQEDLGQAASRNTGLLHAKGDLISFLDADDYWEPTKLERQREILNDDYQFVYSGVSQFEGESGETIGSILPRFEGDCKMAYLKFPSQSIVPAGESSILVTRKLTNKVGLFNQALNSATGRDYFRRCSNFTGFRYVSLELVNYRIHKENMSANKQRMMVDTAMAYKLLFEDPDWKFAMDYRRECLAKLNWSFFKTNLKLGNFHSAIKNFSKIVKP